MSFALCFSVASRTCTRVGFSRERVSRTASSSSREEEVSDPSRCGGMALAILRARSSERGGSWKRVSREMRVLSSRANSIGSARRQKDSFELSLVCSWLHEVARCFRSSPTNPPFLLPLPYLSLSLPLLRSPFFPSLSYIFFYICLYVFIYLLICPLIHHPSISLSVHLSVCVPFTSFSLSRVHLLAHSSPSPLFLFFIPLF